jgi:quercetin dioxygenase-like cupin family protein
MSAFSHVGTVVPQQIWDGVVSRGVHGENMTVTLLELESGKSVPEHSHVNEQVGILVQGSVTFTIDGETSEVEPGGMWVIPAHATHSVVTGPEGAVIVEAFAPPRGDWAELETLKPGPGRWP